MVVMMYTHLSASDYDDWETVYQNPEWGSKDLIPLEVPSGGPTHGTDGPLAVSLGGFFTDLGEQFLQVARTLDPDHAQKPDNADLGGACRGWVCESARTRDCRSQGPQG